MLHGAVVTAGVVLALSACSSDGYQGPVVGTAYVRVINATYLDSSATTVHAPYQAVPIDLLLDSAATDPSFLRIDRNAVSDVSNGTGPTPGQLDAGYHAVPAGVHSFVARLSGLIPEGPSFFTTSAKTQYVPKMYLEGNTFYTLVFTGLAKPQSTSAGALPTLNAPADFGSGFPFLYDDPFPGPIAAGVLEARFRVINAAPFLNADGTGATVFVFVTRTPSLSGIQYLGTADYRSASPYINLSASTVYVSVANEDGSVIYVQQQVAFSAGEVRTLVFQPNRQSFPLTGYVAGSTPSDYKLTNIKDNQY